MVPLTESCCWLLPLVTERLPGWSFSVFAQLTSFAQSQKRRERERDKEKEKAGEGAQGSQASGLEALGFSSWG